MLDIVPYLDDLLLHASLAEILLSQHQCTQTWLQSLGWPINFQTSNFLPFQALTFLWHVIPESQGNTKISQANLRSVLAPANSFCRWLRSLMSTLGHMTACLTAVPWVCFDQRSLRYLVLQVWDHSPNSLEKLVCVPDKVKRSLWWLRPHDLSCGLPWAFLVGKKLTIDANAWGLGCTVGQSHSISSVGFPGSKSNLKLDGT